MRHAIDTAPRDGKVIILEDDASGTYDVGHWSPEEGEWVGENGEPSKISPTHWYPVLRDKYRLQEDEGSSNPGRARRRLAASSITATLIATAFVGLYFRAEVADYVARYAGHQDILRIGTIGGQVVEQATGLLSQGLREAYLLALQQQAEADQAGAQTGAQEAPQVKQAMEAPAPEAGQSLEKEPRPEVLANELAEARRAINGPNPLAGVADSVQSLEQEREKTAALVQEATAARQALTASAAQHRSALDEERARGAALARELATAQRQIETQTAQLHKASDETAQLKQVEAAKSARSLEHEREKTAALAEAATARKELTASTAQHRQALDEERARSATLARELATAQREIETQAALLRKATDETGQLKQAEAAKSAQSLEQEREKTAALAQEASAARQALTASMAQHRQALDEERARRAALWSELATAQHEIETQAALMRKTSDETRQLKQATESTMAELRQSLQQERGRTEAMARDLESARRATDVRVTPELAANSQTPKAAQAVEVAAVAQPAAVEAQGSPEATRLMARASALLGKGDIGAARIVLEHAAETGSAQAIFMLAETYDPVILATWGTYGTRSEATKARELYARAHAGGIQEAKTRFDVLGQ